jgi:hypothetical protein
MTGRRNGLTRLRRRFGLCFDVIRLLAGRSGEQPSPDEFCIAGHDHIDHEKDDRSGHH